MIPAKPDPDLTVADILYDLGGDVAILSINEDGVEHAFFGYDEIEAMDPDIWDRTVKFQLVVRRDWGLMVYLEIERSENS